MQKYNNRSEVPEEFKWDLTPFFKNEEEFNATLKECSKLIDELKSYVGCSKDADKLYEFLNKQIEATALWEDLYVYSYLINDQELGISENLVRKNKTEKLEMELMQNSSFFAPELLNLSKEEYENLFVINPKLEEFRADLDKTYREKEHILTENEEKIVAELTTAMNHYDDMSSNLLNSQHNYGKVKLEVQDNGIGIPKDEINNVMKRFYKVDKSRVNNNSFGIGLSIAERIVNNYKAKIEIESKLDKYTKISVYF